MLLHTLHTFLFLLDVVVEVLYRRITLSLLYRQDEETQHKELEKELCLL
jgi:hypothetical protein